MRNDELTVKEVWRDSVYGPMLRAATTNEERDHICDMAQSEFSQLEYLRNNPGSIPVEIITFAR